jgi:hypothetical protein
MKTTYKKENIDEQAASRPTIINLSSLKSTMWPMMGWAIQK